MEVKSVVGKISKVLGISLILGIMLPSIVLAEEGSFSIAPKLIAFFPNSDSNGLNNYSTGVGIGADARFNFLAFFALAAELDYIGASNATGIHYGSTSATVNGNFSNFAIKIDALLTIPIGIVKLFLGPGLVYNNPSVSVSGGGSSTTLSSSGYGWEIVGGADFFVAENGAITAEISFPLSQDVTFSGNSATVNVGGYELMAGYRFFF